MSDSGMPKGKEAQIEWHKERLKELTGNMVVIRDRKKFNKQMRDYGRDKRARLRELEELAEKNGFEKNGKKKAKA